MNQFVSGLQTELKSKVVGTDGNLEQLLVKARFEEAKRRELAANRTLQSYKKPAGNPPQGPAKKPAGTSTTPNTTETSTRTKRGNWSCYKCGGAGHIARYCPDPRRPKGDREAHGRKGNSVARVSPAEKRDDPAERVEELRRELKAELAADTAGVIRSMGLGPTIMAKVEVNGVSTEALIDTGSLATIISLDFAMVVMAKERPKFQTVEEWMVATQEKFEEPTISLKNYGGEKLDLLAQFLAETQRNHHRSVWSQRVQSRRKTKNVYPPLEWCVC